MSSRRILILGAQLGLVWALVAIVLMRTPVFQSPENGTWDQRVRSFATPVDVPIVLILIDQYTLDWAKKQKVPWPWPRDMYNYILDFCQGGGARAIAFDITFTDLSQTPEADTSLAKKIATVPRFVGAALLGNKVGDETGWPDYAKPNPFTMKGFDAWQAAHPDSELHAKLGAFSIEEITETTATLGHVRAEKDDTDSYIRQFLPVQVFDGQAVPLLSIAAWLVGQTKAGDAPAPGPYPPIEFEGNQLRIGERSLPMDERGRVLVHYYAPLPGSPYAFKTYAASDIIRSQLAHKAGKEPVIPPEALRDRYVLVGMSAPGLYDIQPTPLEENAPGVEIHANVLANLIRGDRLALAPAVPVGLFIVILSITCGAVASGLATAKWIVLAYTLALPLPILAGIAGYFAGLWWPIVGPMFAATASLTSGVIVNYAMQGRQRRLLRRAFAQYLSPKVIDQVTADISQLRLGGVDRELTMFFTDLEGFSSIAERLNPQQITLLLNECLSEVSQAVFEGDGTLDKYFGDAVVAFWNAPADQPNHAVLAVTAALACQKKLKARKEELLQFTAGLPLNVRAGIHTGVVLVGNLGSPQRFNYSMLGDAANLASRLEGANKAFGTHIMVSKETWDQTGGAFIGREIGRIVVKGRETAVTVYEPLAMKGEAVSIDLEKYNEAMDAVKANRLDEAQAIFETMPSDPVAATYVKYLKSLESQLGWDGVWRLQEK
ncbi:MAG: adenylate/guanylate cyclase domain-containing protein [Phycisphaeraceae bacterium]